MPAFPLWRDQEWRQKLDLVSDLLLGLAVLLLWTRPIRDQSALVGVLWLLLRLAIGTPGWGWNLPMLMLVMFNLRGFVLQEGIKPVSSTDYLVIVAAFVAGAGRTLAQWLRTVVVLTSATAIGTLLSLRGLEKALKTMAEATFNLTITPGPNYGGRYFSAGDMSINQTAMAAGLALCLAVPLAVRGRGWLRAWMTICSFIVAVACVATGSRMALGFPPILLIVTLLACRTAPMPAQGEGAAEAAPIMRRFPRKALVGALGATALALTIALGSGRLARLGGLYLGRKTTGDLDRLEILQCYSTLPFRESGFWFYGAGYGAARTTYCDEKVGIDLDHAHNFFVQILADSGLICTAAAMVAGLAITLRLGRLLPQRIPFGPDRTSATLVGPALVAGSLFLFLFNLFELGMMKVTMLELLFGLIPSASCFRPTALMPTMTASPDLTLTARPQPVTPSPATP